VPRRLRPLTPIFDVDASRGSIDVANTPPEPVITVLFEDDFNRADTGSGLSSADWANDASWRITSNIAELTGTGASPNVYYTTDMPSDDHWSEGIILPGQWTDGRMMAVIARYTLAGGFYGLAVHGFGGVYSTSLVRGTDISAPTTLDTYVHGNTSPQHLRLEVEGSDQRGYWWDGSDWNLVLSSTDATYATGTKVGFAGFRFGGAAQCEDYKAGIGFL
jgi:hypothetical protein